VRFFPLVQTIIKILTLEKRL